MRTYTVPDNVGRLPLKTYLSRSFPAMPDYVVKELLKKKDVRINGVKSGSEAFVSAGDELKIYADDKYFGGNLDILYQDEELIVVDKPCGIPVDIDDSGVGSDTVLIRLRTVCPSARLCHRLDTYTGGVLICAKSEKAYERIVSIFERHETEKLYQCIVVGRPPKESDRLRAYLIKNAKNAIVRILDHPADGALPIETHYCLLEEKDGLSRLEVRLITGRTHQIRAHLAHIGCPLLGDDKYGSREANKQHQIYHPLLWCTRMKLDGKVFESKPDFGKY